MVRWADQIRCRYLRELSDDVEMNELRCIIVYHSDSFLNPEPRRDRVESIKVLFALPFRSVGDLSWITGTCKATFLV
jgi:hypothetical protein